MANKVTLSVIKADVGGYVGHSHMHPNLIDEAERLLSEAKKKGAIADFCVLNCGDDLELIMTHSRGENHTAIHGLAWDVFKSCTEEAKKLHLYGAGQDLLKDAFSGNVKGLGPGVAEMEFEERPSEPVVIFMGDKCSPSAWNLPIYKMFADPFNTAGLVIDPAMGDGFTFEILDLEDNMSVKIVTPEEIYILLALIGAVERYLIKRVYRRGNNMIAASASTQKLALIAGKYVGKDDPVLIVRSQSGLPAIGEILEPFSFPHLVEGWNRGSHYGPIYPVPFREANTSRFDGPPRIIAAGFQIAIGALIGPVDLFDDPAFDNARYRAGEIANYMRAHGPFEPHRLPLESMEYTTIPKVIEKLKARFVKEEEVADASVPHKAGEPLEVD
ncbi:MAG: fructose-1,6-bisphosphate aldolase/phosphatase [bacterium]